MTQHCDQHRRYTELEVTCNWHLRYALGGSCIAGFVQWRCASSYLVARFALLWDDGRFDEWIQLSTDDAHFYWRGHFFKGPNEIQELIGACTTARIC